MRRLGLETFRKRVVGVVIEVDELALRTLPHAHFVGPDLELSEMGVRLALRVLALEFLGFQWARV
jgi:hypothetical protein